MASIRAVMRSGRVGDQVAEATVRCWHRSGPRGVALRMEGLQDTTTSRHGSGSMVWSAAVSFDVDSCVESAPGYGCIDRAFRPRLAKPLLALRVEAWRENGTDAAKTQGARRERGVSSPPFPSLDVVAALSIDWH
jgi:hypothetical protein